MRRLSSAPLRRLPRLAHEGSTPDQNRRYSSCVRFRSGSWWGSSRYTLALLAALTLTDCERRSEAPRSVERVDALARDVSLARDVVTENAPSSAPDAARTADAETALAPPSGRAEASEIVTRCQRRREGGRGVVILSGARDAGMRQPSVSIEPLEHAEGEILLDEGQTELAIRGNLRAVGDCYEQALRAQPTLHGYVQMIVTLSPGSSTRRITFAARRDPALERCASRSVRGTLFPLSDGQASRFWVPFTFCNGSE